jgi:hypothetical protein
LRKYAENVIYVTLGNAHIISFFCWPLSVELLDDRNSVEFSIKVDRNNFGIPFNIDLILVFWQEKVMGFVFVRFSGATKIIFLKQ